ncbi:hypothetical protein B5S31_g3851 [[Candida] boidinii]|nr:hypothetical protein B5S31_g3851 [[Candida] boidinii]GME80929.1 unnamed protein product [[Candida] boidinii]
MSNSQFTRSYIPTSSSSYSITDSESDAYFTDARSHMTGVSTESSSDEEADNTHINNNNNNNSNVIRNSLISDDPNGTSLSPQVTITEEIPPTSHQELQLDNNLENEQNSILTNTNLNSQPEINQSTMNTAVTATPTAPVAVTPEQTAPVETAPVELKPLDTPKLNEKALADGNTASPQTDDSDKTQSNLQSNEKSSDNIVKSQPLPNDLPAYKKTEETNKKAYVNTDANKNTQGAAGAPKRYRKEQSECAEYWSGCQCCPCCSCDRESGENIFILCATCLTTSCVSVFTALCAASCCS